MFCWQDFKSFKFECCDAGEDLEARYLLPQWSWLLPPLHNPAKQAAEDIREWRYHLLHQVRPLPVDSLNNFTSFDFYFKLHHFLLLGFGYKKDLHCHKSCISLNWNVEILSLLEDIDGIVTAHSQSYFQVLYIINFMS